MEFCLSHRAGYWHTRSIKDSPILVVSNSNVQCKLKTVSLTFNFCYILSFTWIRVGFVLTPDISLPLGYCFDISLLSLFICCWFWLEYTWFWYQLIISVYLLLILAWIHLILISAYCLWYLMLRQMTMSWFCVHAWYQCLFTTIHPHYSMKSFYICTER